MDVVTTHIIISGRVQGVGFRKWIVYQAKLFHVTGWVKNREDGAVELVIQGNRERLQSFSTFLRRGPPLASVTGFTSDAVSESTVYADFCVIQ